MEEALAASLSYPTVVYTVLLLIALMYWLIALVGLVGVDSLDLDAPDVDVDADADGAIVAAGYWSRSSLRRIPASIALSLVFLFGWLTCHLTTHYAGPSLSAIVSPGLWGTFVLLAATLLALFTSNILATPLTPIFQTHEAARRSNLIGSVVEVRTGRVDMKFGQAFAENGGAGLLVEIRCEPGRLSRGQKALVVSMADDGETYEVEPMDDVLALPR